VKTLIAACLLLALTSFSHAETCAGRVKVDAANELVGGKVLYVDECVFLSSALQRRVLRSCPQGSYCRVEGSSNGDGETGAEIDVIDSVINPYQQGIRNYREGLCYRARPYSSNLPEGQEWERGYHARQTKKQSRRNDEHCFLGRDH
jgi:transcriptional regulator of aromatic amino acid metabolism